MTRDGTMEIVFRMAIKKILSCKITNLWVYNREGYYLGKEKKNSGKLETKHNST